MSYVVLARKYRPHSFEQMVGQDHVVRALTHALEQQRLHHAYLFTGTRGIGKTTVSRILAKSLNCTGLDGQGGITAHPCGQCAACREIDADRYIDYVELDAASNRSIDEIRELIERAAYKPTVGRFKVFMIDEAHQLTKDAFNALLKTLEEPPEYLKFVLATTDPEKMLPTVLSRCLQFNLRPMAPQTVAEHVSRVLAQEAIPVESGALRLIARAARGSMRDALSLTDQAIAYGGGQLQEVSVRAMLGAVDRRHAERLIDALARRDGQAVLAQVDGLRSQGLSAAGTLEEMARMLQWMAIAQTVPTALDTQDPDQLAASQLASMLAADETHLLYSMVLQGRSELSLAPDEHAGLVMVLLRFLAFPPAGTTGAQPSESPSGSAGNPPGPGLSSNSGGSTAIAAAASSGAEVAAASKEMPATVVDSLPFPQPKQTSHPPRPATPSLPGSLSTRPARETPPASTHSTAAKTNPDATQTPLSQGDHIADATDRPGQGASAQSALEPPPWMDDAPPPDDELTLRRHPGQTVDARRSDRGTPELTDEVTRGAVSPHMATGRPSLHDGKSEHVTVPPPHQPNTEQIQRSPMGDKWAEVVAALVEQGSVTALVRELATQSQLMACVTEPDGTQRWDLQVERDTLLMPALSEKLTQALSSAGFADLKLQVRRGQVADSPSRRDAEAARMRQERAERAILSDPGVQTLLAQFSTARIVPGSIRPV